MDEGEILEFCRHWLSAWTGNQPEILIQFYSEDAFYLDPARPEGLYSHKQIRPYFNKLLAANPQWKWEALEVFPTAKGFLLKWRATIPVGKKELVEHGLDIVEIKAGKITRNEVYFDRTRLLTGLSSNQRNE